MSSNNNNDNDSNSNNNINETTKKAPPVTAASLTLPTVSEHFWETMAVLMDTDDASSCSIGKRLKAVDALTAVCREEADAYVTLKSADSRIRLPALDWTAFRKAYTVLMWVRPRRTIVPTPTDATTTTQQDPDATSRTRTVYRFCTAAATEPSRQPDPIAAAASAVGVQVTAGEWKETPNGMLETVLTATALPLQSHHHDQSLQVPIQLQPDTWQLLGFSHVFPYLKRPVWTVTIDGAVAGQGELLYPATETATVMESCLLLNGVTGPNSNSNTLLLSLDVASLALFPVPISPTVQAVVAEAGVSSGAHLLPVLPAVPNWSKGSSLEGPKVGVPIVVHSAALALQRLVSQSILSVTAVNAVTVNAQKITLVAAAALQTGNTVGTPRVGLVQPAAAVRAAPAVCQVTGSGVEFHDALREYTEKHKSQLSLATTRTLTSNLSVAVAEQPLLTFTVLPFFLSLYPPGAVFKAQQELYQDSVKHLFNLWSAHSVYAAALIQLLATFIQAGGARVAEDVLQSGTLHLVAVTMRESLLRGARVKLFSDAPAHVKELQRRFAATQEDEIMTKGASPSHVPAKVVRAAVALIAACCGPAAATMDDLSPAMKIRRTADLALTAVFGVALDFDLWGGDARAATQIYKAVTDRYSGMDLTAGYILRSQLSVQYFLDTLRLRYDSQVASGPLEQAVHHLSLILQAMIFSSLSNRRSVSQGEHDISACMGALSDCPLGSVGSHVILNALVGILVWCEVLPVEAASAFVEPSSDEEHKMQVASRLGRNLLMAQFHDVVAPMILSRTVFSGERTLVQPKASRNPVDSLYEGSLSWQSHWRLSLLLFSWVASIAGPEGMIAAKSSGSLLLASGLAGSLKGALDDADNVFITSLFLPPPGMALMIGSVLKNEWSYTDLLSDRLQIMVPILPGLIVSLLSHPSDATAESVVSVKSMIALSEVLTAAGGAFHRVFGGLIYSSGGTRSQVKNRREGYSESIKAAKTFVPNLIIVAMLLENHVTLRASESEEGAPVEILHPYAPVDLQQQGDSDSWVNVSSTSSASLIEEVVVVLPSDLADTDTESLVIMLHSCQKSVLNVASGLISNAMSLGGSGASISLWQCILSTFGESVVYASQKHADKNEAQDSTENLDPSKKSEGAGLAENVLCRLIALVLTKALKQNAPTEAWSYEMSSAVSKLCLLVEEKGLLDVPKGVTASKDGRSFSSDQIILLCAVLGVLTYGREATGWCQLMFPTMPNTLPDDQKERARHGSSSVDNFAASSKLLLPILQPCIRAALGCLVKMSSSVRILSPTPPNGATGRDKIYQPSAAPREEYMIDRLLYELNFTVTAAVVGLSFSNARDVAFNALASLRQAMRHHNATGDEKSAQQCRSLLCHVAEELRVRYDAERRLRETALFDAYEDSAQDSAKQAFEESSVIERLILGGSVFDSDKMGEASEEITFENNAMDDVNKSKRVGGVSDDFVLFHEPSDQSDTVASDRKVKLGYAQYEGLGDALERTKVATTSDSKSSNSSTETVLSTLGPYLDTWDAMVKRDAEESELVHLFDSGVQLASGERIATVASGENSVQSQQQLQILGSETAADAMSTFFEFAAAEKSRLNEILIRFLPSHRYSRASYAQRFCWARYMEVAPLSTESYWERGVPDGNRDIRTRMPTLPCSPQFRQYIPKHLDQGKVGETASAEHRASAAPGDLDTFTKTLLETANLEIVDVTKKSTTEEDDDEPDVLLRSPSDDDDDDDLFSELSGTQHTEDDQKPGSGTTGTEQTPDEASRVDDTPQGEESPSLASDITVKGSHSITSSAFATPPDNASSSLGLMQSAAAGMIELSLDNCLHIRAEGSRSCTMLLTSTHLILEYDGEPEGFFEGELMAFQEEADRQRMVEEVGGPKGQDPEVLYQKSLERKHREVAAYRPQSIRWNLSEVSHIYLRRYRLRESSLELFFIPSGGTAFGGYGIFSPSTSIFLDFGPGYEGNTRRDDAAVALMKRAPPQAVKQWPDRSDQFLHDQLSRLAMGWVEGRVTNFDYLLHLNMLSGRSYNDICQYPVFPWVLADYTSEEIPDLTLKKNFRDLTKPVGALNSQRLDEFIERFNSFADPYIPPFMYGSHYSTSAGVVLHFLVRQHPFAGLHRQLQGGHFDVADRLFSSVPRTYSMVTGTSAAEVKELTPEWYCNPAFLKNANNLKLGTSQDGDVIGDVELPPWAKGSPEKFVEVMRAALESDRCSEMLPDWVDLVFGYKQKVSAEKCLLWD
jgi:hypothetical protein